MKTDESALSVTIVSTDRAVLRELSWTLSLFGYHVTATTEYSEDSPWRRDTCPGILLIDTLVGEEADQIISATRTAHYQYRIAIHDFTSGESCERLLTLGVDDVVRKPTNLGELLTRLRAGVRRLEFERRLGQHAMLDSASGLPSRRGLERQIQERNLSGRTGPVSLLVVGVDFLPLIEQQSGVRAVQHLSTNLAKCIAEDLGEQEIGGVLAANAFALLLNRSPEAAEQFAKQLATSYSSCETLARAARTSPTLSALVVPWSADQSIAAQLDQCETTFCHLQSCGGDCVVHAQQLRDQISTWRTNMDEGVPFEEVIAQDLMEMFPITFTTHQLDSGLAAGVVSPQLLCSPCFPVVDDEGTLVGVIDPGQLASSSGSQTLRQPPTLHQTQTLSEMFDAFTVSDESQMVVVDDDNRPIGYLSSEGLASLVLDPISAVRYQQSATASQGLSSLVVPVESQPTPVPGSAIAPC
ncbi:CBS domain protein [Posidoniimonas polymericola]|uniref:CBS domain protein n=1 Tax=Posidoniimonas polymericola TaxID=2528002 RepID=A0A5C5XWL6_9BACT|nr:CBS domain-containing protein [Posidoniimonas polymericola]TWT67757.1 CBS domain protein [Posidoniimonas polymericola]